MTKPFVLCALLFAVASPLSAKADPPRDAAETYLKALMEGGDQAGKGLLLGGVTMTAQLLTLENWKIVSEDPVRNESGDLKKAKALMKALDASGSSAMQKLMEGGGGGGDDLSMHEVSQEEANRLMRPTDKRARAFKDAFPVLAYVARVGKPVYWHPKNPIRPLLASARSQGGYRVEVHRYMVETTEGAAQTPRRWPLRVLRITTDELDTGWKILPASDWNGD